MRILHCSPYLSGGGAERQLSYLVPELLRLGHQVDVAYLHEGPLRPDLGGATLHRIRARGNYDPAILLQLLSIVVQTRPDVIHSWVTQMDVVGSIIAHLTHRPYIIRESTSAGHYSRDWKNRLRVWAGKRSDAIVSNSLTGDEYWSALKPAALRSVIPNALPLDDIEAARRATAEECGLSDDRRFVLYVGRLENRQKNLDNLMRALQMVCESTPVDALICGDGPYRPEIEAAASQIGTPSRIHVLGFSPVVWSLMKRAAVFVSVSHYEGRPNTVIEAMACGCPLVVSDIPEHREFLDSESALLVSGLNPDSISTAILHHLNEPDAAAAMAAVAKARTSDWSISAMALRYERVYQTVCERRAPGSAVGRLRPEHQDGREVR